MFYFLRVLKSHHLKRPFIIFSTQFRWRVFPQKSLQKLTDYYSATMFLIPVFVVGYSIWEKEKKKEEERSKKFGPQSPESVEGPVFEGTADLLTRQSTEDSDSSSNSNSSKGEEGDDGDMALTSFALPREKVGPFRAIRKFFAEAKGNNEAFRIKTNEDNLTFEVMGNQGDLALNFPRISFK